MAFRDIFRGVVTSVFSPGSNRTMSRSESVPGLRENCVVIELPGANNRNLVAEYSIFLREDCVILHGPLEESQSPVKYNIILHVPCSERMFSLYRTNDIVEAEIWFLNLKTSLVPLVKLDDKLICYKAALDNVNRELQSNAGWSAAHLAAAMDWPALLIHPSLRSLLNEQDEGPERKTPLHIAIKYKNLRSVMGLINAGARLDVMDANDNTVFHEAVARPDRKVEILETLLTEAELRAPGLKDCVNNQGCTPLHIACEQNCNALAEALLRGGANVNIPHQFKFPIHIAVHQKDACSVKEIVAAHRDQLFVKDLKDGGTPLHWAQGHELVGLLLELGCDPNLPDNQGRSPLHLAAQRGDLKAAVLLLSHHGFPDMRDVNGDTPLHVASRLCSTPIMKALIVFGANIKVRNAQGHSPRHLLSTSTRSDWEHALFYLDRVGAPRCGPPDDKSMDICTKGCSYKDNFAGIPPKNYPNDLKVNVLDEALKVLSITTGVRRNVSSENGRVKSQPAVGGRVLCLDGGGIRGLVLTQCLLVIEEYIGRPITDLFDWIAGTSTGGILALGLACDKTVLDLQALYMRFKDTVFTGQRPYDSKVMESFLKKEFGEEKKMINIRRPRVMITTTLADTRPAQFHMFRNYLSPQTIINQNSEPDAYLETEVWKVAKWTGAAPSYFKLDGSKYIDGGLISNNPTQDALTEIAQAGAALRATSDTQGSEIGIPTVVVSLGCGIQPTTPVDVAHLDIAVPKGIFEAVGVIPRLQACLNLLVDQATQSEGQVVERSRAWCSTLGIPFFRFSPECPVFVDLDETKDEVLVDLMWLTRAKMLLQKHQLEELKQLLLQEDQTIDMA